MSGGPLRIQMEQREGGIQLSFSQSRLQLEPDERFLPPPGWVIMRQQLLPLECRLIPPPPFASAGFARACNVGKTYKTTLVQNVCVCRSVATKTSHISLPTHLKAAACLQLFICRTVLLDFSFPPLPCPFLLHTPLPLSHMLQSTLFRSLCVSSLL